MMRAIHWVILAALTASVGCGSSERGAETTLLESDAPSRFVLATEPPDALPVGTARETIQSEQSATVIGRIGGSTEPFVDGLAAFTIVDAKVPHCAADEGCPTPWDYCCTQDQVKDNIATVKVVDDTGNPVPVDARALIDAKELSMVVVQGTAKRDDQGNLTIAADKVFVREGE